MPKKDGLIERLALVDLETMVQAESMLVAQIEKLNEMLVDDRILLNAVREEIKRRLKK